MVVYQVIARRLSRSLTDFIKMLEPGLPRTNTMLMAAKRVRDGKITANFYTAGWPEFSTVVCQLISPRLSDEADLLCHSTTKEGLLHVMKEAELVTWGKWQTIGMAEVSHADYLVENLKPPGQSEPGLKSVVVLNQFFLPGKLQGQDKPCPEGFVLGKLEPQHLDHVASQWYQDLREKSKHHLTYTYLDHMITHCESAAIYQTDDLTVPVAWVMQYPHGQIGHGFTHEEYRGRGFQILTGRKVSKLIIAGGDLPEFNSFDNSDSTLVKELGFVDMYQTMWLQMKTKGY